MSFFVACGKFGAVYLKIMQFYISWSALGIFYETLYHAGKQQTKVMPILVSFPPKSSFFANGKFIDFKMALRGRAFSPIGAMRNFAGEIFCWVVGIWQGVFLTIWTFFTANKNNILYILNLKSKLEWPVCTKSIKIKMVQQLLPQLKINVLLGHNIEIVM